MHQLASIYRVTPLGVEAAESKIPLNPRQTPFHKKAESISDLVSQAVESQRSGSSNGMVGTGYSVVQATHKNPQFTIVGLPVPAQLDRVAGEIVFVSLCVYGCCV